MNKYNFYLKVFIKVIESSIVVRSKTTADEDRQNKRNAYRMIMNSRLYLCIEEVGRERLLMELLWCGVRWWCFYRQEIINKKKLL